MLFLNRWLRRFTSVLQRITRSLAKSCRRYRVTVDASFDEVLDACADPTRNGTWIHSDFIKMYRELHRRGHAHSFETRDAAGVVVGGLICVEQGGLVNGDSMSHRQRDASKVASAPCATPSEAPRSPRGLWLAPACGSERGSPLAETTR